jgi:hypothetical protein
MNRQSPQPRPLGRLTITPAEMVAAFTQENGVLVNDFMKRALAVRDAFRPRAHSEDKK